MVCDPAVFDGFGCNLPGFQPGGSQELPKGPESTQNQIILKETLNKQRSSQFGRTEEYYRCEDCAGGIEV